MWPSVDVATRLYDLANTGLVISLVVGAIATVLVVWMGNMKESYLRLELSSTAQKASEADARAAVANERASNSETATEMLRAKNLELERWLAPRELAPNDAATLRAATHLPQFKGRQIWIVSVEDAEALRLAQQLGVILKASGLDVTVGMGGTPINPPMYGAAYPATGDPDLFKAIWPVLLNASIGLKPDNMPRGSEGAAGNRIVIGLKPPYVPKP